MSPIEGTIHIISVLSARCEHDRNDGGARWLAPLMIITFVCLVQGCADVRDTPLPASPPPPVNTRALPAEKIDPILAHVIPPKRRDRERQQAPIELDRLVGMPVNSVQKLLGSPAVVREEKAATIWTYHAQDCELDLYFYMDMATRNLQSLTYDVRSTTPGREAGPQICVQSIQTGRSSAGTR